MPLKTLCYADDALWFCTGKERDFREVAFKQFLWCIADKYQDLKVAYPQFFYI